MFRKFWGVGIFAAQNDQREGRRTCMHYRTGGRKSLLCICASSPQKERGKVISVGDHICTYIICLMDKNVLIRTLAIDSLFKRSRLGILVKFID